MHNDYDTQLERLKTRLDTLYSRVDMLTSTWKSDEEEAKPVPTFKVGDLVVFVSPTPVETPLLSGTVGVVRRLNPGADLSYGVEWAGFQDGHSLAPGRSDDYTLTGDASRAGWWVSLKHLRSPHSA